jgi:hypothetical protein
MLGPVEYRTSQVFISPLYSTFLHVVIYVRTITYLMQYFNGGHKKVVLHHEFSLSPKMSTLCPVF